MRERLESEREGVVELLLRLRGGLNVTSEGDDTEKILAFSGREQASRDIERLQGRLHNLDLALLRVANRTYGICDGCGEEISEKRLAVVPWAARCLGCQEKEERRNGR